MNIATTALVSGIALNNMTNEMVGMVTYKITVVISGVIFRMTQPLKWISRVIIKARDFGIQ